MDFITQVVPAPNAHLVHFGQLKSKNASMFVDSIQYTIKRLEVVYVPLVLVEIRSVAVKFVQIITTYWMDIV
jgi:hypothetical protein